MNVENYSKTYKTDNHLIYSCQYHVIFCPKYRRKVLNNGVDIRLKEIIYEVANQYNFTICELEVMEDYVHLLIDCNPKFGIAECVKKIKGISSHKLRSEFPYLKSRIPTLWTRSSFISTVGTVSLEVVKQYIENQKYV